MKTQLLFDATAMSFASSKESIATMVHSKFVNQGFTITASNVNKPWGIEYKIKEDQAWKLFDRFFAEKNLPVYLANNPFGPKILIIEESKRLSWHVHERKDAFLLVLYGVVSVYTSSTDEEPTTPTLENRGALIHIPQLIRHRLGSVAGWSVVAEISRNVFPDHPSDDADERRISDDFGRR